ncbi:hypothetical protein TNCT_131321 [Trichonephila clavata]|uniref:Uncharacterized protein n=1 Tax=Trichonephila clavata TaxID=2740835 RepID=A0A8X6LKZ2_TRICU|nr:hypothetical protein TNCT_131321 [Trichonephila clavata]
MERLRGELAPSYPCPNPHCYAHNKIPDLTYLENVEFTWHHTNTTHKTNNPPTTINPSKKQTDKEGFTSPSKTKKLKLSDHPNVRTENPIKLSNKFDALTPMDAEPQITTQQPTPIDKIPPIMLKYKNGRGLTSVTIVCVTCLITRPNTAKCGQEHRTKDCIITEKLDNPTCINCKEVGHLANSFNCPKYPQIKKKTSDQVQNKNENRNLFQADKVTAKDLSYANALKGTISVTKPNISQPDTQTTTQSQYSPHSTTNENDNEKPFGIMDAVFEIKKLFADYPFLLELGKQLRAAKGKDRIDAFYQHVMEIYE